MHSLHCCCKGAPVMLVCRTMDVQAMAAVCVLANLYHAFLAIAPYLMTHTHIHANTHTRKHTHVHANTHTYTHLQQLPLLQEQHEGSSGVACALLKLASSVLWVLLVRCAPGGQGCGLGPSDTILNGRAAIGTGGTGSTPSVAEHGAAKGSKEQGGNESVRGAFGEGGVFDVGQQGKEPLREWLGGLLGGCWALASRVLHAQQQQQQQQQQRGQQQQRNGARDALALVGCVLAGCIAMPAALGVPACSSTNSSSGECDADGGAGGGDGVGDGAGGRVPPESAEGAEQGAARAEVVGVDGAGGTVPPVCIAGAEQAVTRAAVVQQWREAMAAVQQGGERGEAQEQAAAAGAKEGRGGKAREQSEYEQKQEQKQQQGQGQEQEGALLLVECLLTLMPGMG
eukprot:scaffold127251_cov16-Tisochrysis_lutea.AAC.1